MARLVRQAMRRGCGPVRSIDIVAMACGALAGVPGALAGPLGSDPNAAFRQSRVIAVGVGGNSITVDSAAYAPGTVIGASVPTSPTLWTYAFQIFDSGVTFDRVRLDTAIGGVADSMGLAPNLGQTGGASPSLLHLSVSGLPAADYFTTPISGSAFTTTIYFTSPMSPYPGILMLGNGSELPQDRVVFAAGAVYTPVPGAGTALGMSIGGAALGWRGRRRDARR